MAVYEKSYIYKVYRDGVFLGVLPNVISEFQTSQQINTLAVELPIVVQTQFDTAELAPPYLETEDGQIFETEDGQPFTLERYPDVVGLQDGEALIRNNNDLVVIEYSEDEPNGIQVFEGYISKWRAKYGAGSDIVTITALSYGTEAANYVAKSGSTLAINQSTAQTGSRDFSYTGGISGNSRIAESFRATGDYGVSKISIEIRNQYNWFYGASTSKVCKLTLYQGVIPNGLNDPTGGGSYLGEAQVAISNSAYQMIDFVFGDPIDVSSGQDYYFVLESTTPVGSYPADFQVGAAGTGALSNAQVYTYYSPYGTFPEAWQSYGGSTEQLVFQVYSSAGNTTAEYEDTDPADMLRDALDSAIGQGSHLNYDSSIESTPYLVDYTFKVATIQEVADKARELAPSNWFYYVDPADTKFYFKEPSTTPDHTFVKGVHLSELDIEADSELIRNLILFSGGDVGGGVNLFNQYTNQDSITLSGRQKLERMSDNRVTVPGTADRLAESFLEERADEIIRSGLFLPASLYDVTTVNIGDMIRVTGMGNWIDEELIQITDLKRMPTGLFMTLGKLPVEGDSFIDEIKRDLAKQQTINNPDQPS